MAKPRQTVVIEKYTATQVYCLYVTAPDALWSSIKEIEGITDVGGQLPDGSRRIKVNLRYSLDDIQAEIIQLAADYDNAKNLLNS